MGKMGSICRSSLSGPTATIVLSRYTVALYPVALRFPASGKVPQENRATPTEKGPVAPTFSALKGGAALQVTSWKLSRYRGVSQLHCRLSRCNASALSAGIWGLCSVFYFLLEFGTST